MKLRDNLSVLTRTLIFTGRLYSERVGNGGQAVSLIPSFEVVVGLVLQFFMILLPDLTLCDPTKFLKDVVKHGS